MNDLSVPYRFGVGLCIFNKQGLVLFAERRDQAGSWQMPQGGVQKDENLQIAALRELREEIGTDNVRLLARTKDLLHYDFPDYASHKNGIPFNGKYKGQEQFWFAGLFLGEDSDINLDGSEDPEPAEFVKWEWIPFEDSVKRVVDFKRPLYESFYKEFLFIEQAIKNGEELPSLICV